MAAPAKKGFEMFVSRIPWTLASKELKTHFRQFGHVKKCTIHFDKDTGFHKGFAWLTFSSETGLNNALQCDSHIIEGSKVAVQRNRRRFLQLEGANGAEES